MKPQKMLLHGGKLAVGMVKWAAHRGENGGKWGKMQNTMTFVLIFLHMHLFHSTSLCFSAPWGMYTPLWLSLPPLVTLRGASLH